METFGFYSRWWKERAPLVAAGTTWRVLRSEEWIEVMNTNEEAYVRSYGGLREEFIEREDLEDHGREVLRFFKVIP